MEQFQSLQDWRPGVQQGVVGAKTSGGERRGVNGTDGGQSTIRASLDIGFNVVQRCCGLVVGAGGEKEGGQQKVEERYVMAAHGCKGEVELTKILKKRLDRKGQGEREMPGRSRT